MPAFGPISRRNLVRCLTRLGFGGPIAGGKHEVMIHRETNRRITLPKPHRGEISRNLLARLLRQAEIEREEWERLLPPCFVVQHSASPRPPLL